MRNIRTGDRSSSACMNAIYRDASETAIPGMSGGCGCGSSYTYGSVNSLSYYIRRRGPCLAALSHRS